VTLRSAEGLVQSIVALPAPSRARGPQGRRSANLVSSWILFATAVAVPLPFGSTEPMWSAVWCILLGIAVAAASPARLRNGHMALLAVPFVVIASYGLVLHEQLSPHPWFATTHPLWDEASQALGRSIEPLASIARGQPFYSLGAPLAAILALVCSLLVCADRARARQLVKAVAWSGSVYAVYGIVAYAVDPTRLLWREKHAYVSDLTSTFINHNTAAVYLGACAILCLTSVCEEARGGLPPGPIRWREIVRAPLSRPWWLAMTFVCLGAMFMTHSRAGVLISLFGVVVAVLAYFYRDLRGGYRLLLAAGAGAAIAATLLQTMGSGVMTRFDTEYLAEDGRLATYRAALRMIGDHPWFGTGLGTFAAAYPAYRSDQVPIWGVWDRAHNSLLELAADLGVPLTALIALAWLAALFVLFRGVRARRHGCAVPASALAIAIAALLHSLVDFSLQIPGYAIVVFAIVGAGLSQSIGAQPDETRA
jgi:O-antigen ligase